MTKTPYEIRLELIVIAKDMLMDEYHSKKEYILEQWRNSREDCKSAGFEPIGAPRLPDFPTELEILNKATALNEFVSNSKR